MPPFNTPVKHRARLCMDEHRIREIYQRSLDTNRATFAEGEYDIAYHLLLVALQCAQRLSDANYLTEITRLAEKESRFIDDHHPEYAFSSKAAIRRGTLGLFQTPALKARAILTTKNGNARGHFAEQQPLKELTPLLRMKRD